MTKTTLQLPPFLHGTFLGIEKQAKAEGRKEGHQFQLSGTLPHPEPRPVAPDDVVFTHPIVDVQREAPAWRLYLLSEAVMSVCETDEKNHLKLSALYETTFRHTAWGALYFALSGDAPESAAQTALRLKAVLDSWDSLHHGRYLHRTLNTFLTLEELLIAACGWTLDAWCPEAGPSLRSRFEVASDRMAQATRQDCVDVILRRLPRIFSLADMKKINHPAVVTQLDFWREQLTHMDAISFERISGVHPGEVLGTLYQWDRRLDMP